MDESYHTIITINRTKKPIKGLLIDKSAKRPPKWLPIEKPTPINTNMNVMKVGEAWVNSVKLGAI